MDQLRTLPEISLSAGIPLDRLRTMCRTDPALAALGRRAGPVRVFTPAEAEKLVAAHKARQAKRQPAPVA